MLEMYLNCRISIHGEGKVALSGGDGLVEKRLKDDDFVAFFNEGHKGTKHAWGKEMLVLVGLGDTRTDVPSFAPVVMVTSDTGSILRPKESE